MKFVVVPDIAEMWFFGREAEVFWVADLLPVAGAVIYWWRFQHIENSILDSIYTHLMRLYCIRAVRTQRWGEKNFQSVCAVLRK